MNNGEYINYGQFNALTATGRITFVAIKTGRNGDFLSMSVISTLSKNGQEVDLDITDSGVLMDMFQRGLLVTGREVTVTGHIFTISEVYTADGQTKVRKRPQIKLTEAVIMSGGLGMLPKAKAANAVRRVSTTITPNQVAPVDQAPELTTAGADGNDLPW